MSILKCTIHGCYTRLGAAGRECPECVGEVRRAELAEQTPHCWQCKTPIWEFDKFGEQSATNITTHRTGEPYNFRLWCTCKTCGYVWESRPMAAA